MSCLQLHAMQKRGLGINMRMPHVVRVKQAPSATHAVQVQLDN